MAGNQGEIPTRSGAAGLARKRNPKAALRKAQMRFSRRRTVVSCPGLNFCNNQKKGKI